jgi:hypothetical protein
VILNTMCEANQERFDQECPADFQSASYLSGWGQLDMVLEEGGNSQGHIQQLVARVSGLLLGGGRSKADLQAALALGAKEAGEEEGEEGAGASAIDMQVPFDYRNSVSACLPLCLPRLHVLPFIHTRC